MVVVRDIPVLARESGVARLDVELQTISRSCIDTAISELTLMQRRNILTVGRIDTEVGVRELDSSLALVDQPVLSGSSVAVVAAFAVRTTDDRVKARVVLEEQGRDGDDAASLRRASHRASGGTWSRCPSHCQLRHGYSSKE